MENKTSLSAWEKVKVFLMAAAAARVDKRQQRWEEDHVVVGTIQAPYINNEKRAKRGQSIPVMDPHTRVLTDKDGKQRRVLVEVQHSRFVGWERGKKYTGDMLRKLHKERNVA